MLRPGITIDLPANTTAKGLLLDLSHVQHQRFSERVHALNDLGIEPGDAWQVAASHQRQADLPSYKPTSAEQKVAEQVSGLLTEPSQSERNRVGSLASDVGSTDSDTASSSDSGVQRQDESPDKASVRSLNEPPVETEVLIATQGRGSSNHSSPSQSAEDGAADAATDADQQAIAEDIFDNARRFMDNAIAAGAVADSQGELRAENGTYTAMLNVSGVMRVENRKTGGIAISDKTGVREATGLTAADQQTWRSIHQVSEAERQQEPEQRTPQTALEL